MEEANKAYRYKNLCNDYMHRRCKKDDCKFFHDDTVCFYYWKNGECRNGDNCKRSHNARNLDLNKCNPKRNKDKYNKNKRVKNTVCFEPMTNPVDMRLVYDLSPNSKFNLELTSRDVLLVPNLFNEHKNGELYNKLVEEIESCGIDQDILLKLWHGNDKIEGTHLIANDRANWKQLCPTFNYVIEKIKDYFDIDIQATRLNWYKDTSQWKPFHHDAAAIKSDKAKLQNFTVAVSFGATREAAFEHATTKTVVSMPQQDGCIYAFSNSTNVIWRHGILQDNPVKNEGRISIICWGSIDNIKQI
jgi:hypothetical protein